MIIVNCYSFLPLFPIVFKQFSCLPHKMRRKITTKIAYMQVFEHFFFAWAEFYSAIIVRLKAMRIAYMPLENGVPKRPFRPQAQAADTTVFTGHIPIRRGRNNRALAAKKAHYNQSDEKERAGKKRATLHITRRTRTYFRREPTRSLQSIRREGACRNYYPRAFFLKKSTK